MNKAMRAAHARNLGQTLAESMLHRNISSVSWEELLEQEPRP
jgi:hypothetical protein